MKWKELSVHVKSDDPDLAMDLVSEIFYSLGANGVIIEDPRDEPMDSWAEDAPPRPEKYAVIGFLPENASFLEKVSILQSRIADLSAKHGFILRLVQNTVDEEDWAESWKAFFHPLKIGDRIVVKPTWRSYEISNDDLVVELDPGMAFGTGTHPTTALCIRLLETYVRNGMRVLDIGTGSGILLIAAALLGAGTLRGIDNDPLAVEVATANLIRNRIPSECFKITEGDLLRGANGKPFGLVVANILSHVIEGLLDDIPQVMEPNGVFICSGIISDNRERIESKMRRVGFEVISVLTQEEWVAMAGRWPSP